MATTIRQSEDNENESGDLFDGNEELKYLIVRPERGGLMELWKYMVWFDIGSGVQFFESSNHEIMNREAADHRWIILVSIVIRKILHVFGKPMEYTGYFIDFFLNLLHENGGLFGLFCNFIRGNVVIPQRGTESFISTLGHLDGRIELYSPLNLPQKTDASSSSVEKSIKTQMDHRALTDLCVMASKLAYENAKVVQNVVVHHWKMHFVDFYDCWNDFQKENSTQVFIICDKPKDAGLILISFRGTEPFDADDWSTDFDYSWYEVPKLGKVHMGFLEALGLGNRGNIVTFHNHLQKNNINSEVSLSEMAANVLPPDMLKKSAYYAVRKKLRSLLEEHKNAEFVVTGHSLGGALATLFPTVLVLHEEMKIMQRFLGLYTFGQPRIGDMRLGKFMEAHLERPCPKYFRIVYCNDLVPRLPYDDKTFLYKHFGVCLYYDSCYIEQKMEEEPDRNFFGLRYVIPMYLNAAWELLRSLIIGYVSGPEYREGWFSILFRVVGLVLPGISDHRLTDYVNSVRLGREMF